MIRPVLHRASTSREGNCAFAICLGMLGHLELSAFNINTYDEGVNVESFGLVGQLGKLQVVETRGSCV